MSDWSSDGCSSDLYAGSSGGALTALLLFALENGTVDRVVQVNADPAFPTRNRVVVSHTADEVIAAAGSRYAASSPLSSIIAELDKGGRFAFVGKHCDLSALRELAKSGGRVDQQIRSDEGRVGEEGGNR